MILLDAIPGKTHTSLAIKRCDQLRGRLPDLLDRHGLSEEVLIDKYLRPLLTAKETIFFQKDHFRSYPLVVCGSPGLKALRRSTEVYLPSEGVRSLSPGICSLTHTYNLRPERLIILKCLQ